VIAHAIKFRGGDGPAGGPRILAIDTAATRGSLALVEGSVTIAEVVLEEPNGFSHVIFSAIESLLARHGWTLKSIDGFAAGAGPGSFTGIRVALGVVKGLAEALDRPAYGISNLRAAARLGAGEVRAPWLDARRGEIFGAVYSAHGECLDAEAVGKIDKWLAELPAGAAVFPADGVPLAAAIGAIAAARWRAGDRPDNLTLDANYVRRSDAELAWTDARRA
jgi:tRNA threonylcarbamoyladenosine biosynthesis protein TsaB